MTFSSFMPLFTPSRTRTQNFESFQTTQHHQHELDSFNFNFQRPKNTSYITAQEDRNCHTTNKETQSDNSFQHTNPTETYMHVRQSTPLTSTTLFHLALTQAQASTWMGHIYTWCDSPRKRTRDMHVCTFKKAVQTDDMETTITTRRHFEDDCEPPTNKQTSVRVHAGLWDSHNKYRLHDDDGKNLQDDGGKDNADVICFQSVHNRRDSNIKQSLHLGRCIVKISNMVKHHTHTYIYLVYFQSVHTRLCDGTPKTNRDLQFSQFVGAYDEYMGLPQHKQTERLHPAGDASSKYRPS